MCNKQCRDENGFKCHLTSESHQRQLLLFGETPDTYLSEFSVTFEKVRKCCVSTKPVFVIIVLVEKISERAQKERRMPD